MIPTIAVLNQSTLITDDEVRPIAAALQIQADRDYAPVWGGSALIRFYSVAEGPPVGSQWLVFLDDADQAGALGYHELTSEGLPIGKVFVRTTTADGGSISVVASHELLEMLGDPDVNSLKYATDAIRALENCDAVEADEIGYTIDVPGHGPVLVSDFVYPEWFNEAAPAGSRFDFLGHVSEPLQLLPGGYIGILKGNRWSQITADLGPHHSAAHRYRGNRWSRRQMAPADRRPSTAHAGVGS